MAHATNRTEMLAKALKRAREDFSLHNARVFARSVIEAPSDVFAAKPLTFLPLDQSNSNPWRAAAEAVAGDPAQRYDPVDRGEPGRFAASGRYLKERYGPDSSTWSPPEGLDPDGPTTALAAVIPAMLEGDFADAIDKLRDTTRRWPEQCDLHRALFFALDRTGKGDGFVTPDQVDELHSHVETFGELVAELGLEPSSFSMRWELPEMPLQLPLATRTDVRAAYAAHRLAAGDRDAAEQALDWAIIADKDPDPARAALSRRAATAVESLIAFKNERWDELAGLAAELSAPGADSDDNTAEALVALGYGFAALALMEQGSSGNAMIRAAESYQFVAVNAWLDLQLGLRARRAGDEDTAQRHFGAGMQLMRLPALYEAAAAVQPSPRARRRAEHAARAARDAASRDALRRVVGDTLYPILPGDIVTDGEGSEHEFGVYMGEDRVYTRDGQRQLVDLPEARTVHYDVRQVDPLTAITNPDLAWVSTLAQLTALCGWDADSPEALLLDTVLRPEYRQQRSITTLAELVDHLRNSGDEHARSVHDRIRFRITDPSPLVDRTAGGPISLGVSGHQVDFPDATSARLAQEPAAISPDGTPDQDLRAVAESAGIQLNAEDERRVRVSPAEVPPAERTVPVSPSQVRPGDLLISGGKTYVSLGNSTLLDIESRGILREDDLADGVSFTGPEEGYFRPVGRQGEWAAFAKALSTAGGVAAAPKVSADPLKVVPPPKFPQLSAESEDQIDVPALVREMGGAPQAGELFDRVVPMSMMSRAMIKAISSGAVKLNADRTVTLPEPASEPMLDLPASATRPHIERRDPGDAVKLWQETTFHVGVGTERPVMWSPAEAGSMLVTGRTGSGTSVFVQGAVTEAQISGWDIIWLDRHVDADTYAETIANVHTLSAQRTADQAPVLVVLDEYQAFSRKFAAAHTKAEVAQLSNQMLDMLELARSSRVHLLLATHDLHAQTIPSTWLPHFGAAVAMGQPSEMALRKLSDGVKVPSEAFPRAVRGRAAFFDRTQPGTYQVVQTYLPTQAKDALAFAFGEDEMARMDPELTRKLVERPDRPLTPHEFIAGINGGPKLWDAVGEITQNKNPVDSMLGSMMGALFGRPASAPTVDPSKPNHFYFDSLGDPLTCTEDHNHPSGPDDEPGHNVKIRAQHELERLPEPITRRVAPRDGDRRDPAPVSELGLGIGPDGERVTYAPATDGPLLIIGDRGRGKTSMVSGLNREAEVLGWDTVWLETQKTSRYVRDRLDEVREEIGRRVVGASDVSKPMLVTLDDSLFTDWGDESRTEISSLVTTLLEKGPEVNVHLVAATGPRQRDYFLSLWPAGAAVLLTGAPTAEESSALFGDAADLLPRSGWEGSGKMVLVRDPKVTEGFLPAPLRAYTERPPKRYDDF